MAWTVSNSPNVTPDSTKLTKASGVEKSFTPKSGRSPKSPRKNVKNSPKTVTNFESSSIENLPKTEQLDSSAKKKSIKRKSIKPEEITEVKLTPKKGIKRNTDILDDNEFSTKENKSQCNIVDYIESSIKKYKKISFKNPGDTESKNPPSEIVNKMEATPEKTENDKNAERRVKKKNKQPKREIDPEEQARTVFVGNLPISSKKDHIEKFFSTYGKVDSVRIRGVPVADPKTPKKIAFIKGKFHPQRNSFCAYVKFATPEDAANATTASGHVYNDHHLRVELQSKSKDQEENKAIFVGNLSFDAEDDELWQCFEVCGPIVSVRIVRDSNTLMAKGFGYVNFKNADSVQLALDMEDVVVQGRQLRISACNLKEAHKNKRKNTAKKIKKPGKPKKPRTVKPAVDSKEVNTTNAENGVVEKKGFQGAKFEDKRKKNKLNKGLQQKKRMVKKLAPRPQ